MNTEQFFNGLTVIELASVLAGPAVGMFFAELGAKVIKIENAATGGDTTRKWKLPEEDPDVPYSVYFHSVNWHKESLMMDLTDQGDYEQLRELIKTADIVISNHKTSSAKRLKIDYAHLQAINPRLIYGHISAYGPSNPKPGFDVVIQAEAAWISMNGEKNGLPVKMPVALMDLLTAHQLKEGLLLALLHRYQTGKGSKVSVSLFDSGVASLANQASNWLNLDRIAKPMGSQHPNIAPYGDTFLSKDQKALISSTGTQKQYEGLIDLLELGELKQDPRFTTNSLRLTYREELYDLLAEGFARFTAKEILDRCQEKKVPVAPIRNMQELFELPEAQALVLEEEMPDGVMSKRVKTVVFQLEE